MVMSEDSPRCTENRRVRALRGLCHDRHLGGVYLSPAVSFHCTQSSTPHAEDSRHSIIEFHPPNSSSLLRSLSSQDSHSADLLDDSLTSSSVHVRCVAREFLPSLSRVMFLPSDWAFSPSCLLLAEEEGEDEAEDVRGYESGKDNNGSSGCDHNNNDNSNSSSSKGSSNSNSSHNNDSSSNSKGDSLPRRRKVRKDWRAALSRQVEAFQREYKCSRCQVGCVNPDLCFKKFVTAEKLELVVALLGALKRCSSDSTASLSQLHLETLLKYWHSLPSPEALDDVLFCWSEEEKALIADTTLGRVLPASKQYVEELYKHVFLPFVSDGKWYSAFGGPMSSSLRLNSSELLSSGDSATYLFSNDNYQEVLTFESFWFLCSLVNSRAFSCPSGGLMLLPFADICNGTCVSGQENAVLEVVEDMFAIRTTRDISAGEELRLLYNDGSVSSADFLFAYGFLPLENCALRGAQVLECSHNHIELLLGDFIDELLAIRHKENDRLRCRKRRFVTHSMDCPLVLRVSRSMLLSQQPQVLPLASQICRLIHVLLCDADTFTNVESGKVAFPRLDRVIDDSRKGCTPSGDPVGLRVLDTGKLDKFAVLRAFQMLLDMHLPISSRRSDANNGRTGFIRAISDSPELLSANLTRHKHFVDVVMMNLTELAVWDLLTQQFIALPFVVQEDNTMFDFGKTLWGQYFGAKDHLGNVAPLKRSLLSSLMRSLSDSHESFACCAWCGGGQSSDEGLLRCSRCQLVHYCCQGCQREHWKYHKRQCKKS